MEPTLDQVRQELADIHDELLQLPADDFARRAELHSRQNELRQLSAKLVDGLPLHDAAVLKAAHERLQAVRDHLIEERLGASSSGGDSVWGGISVALNKAIDDGVGTAEIEQRLKEIVDQLRTSG
jgi:septation ring formation regulator EzrA